jgi:hypothetical protein
VNYLAPLLLIAGGLLGASTVIISRSPNAARVIDALTPFKMIIGVAMLIYGVVLLFRAFLFQHLLTTLRLYSVTGGAALATCVCMILLGFLFGLPQVIKWMPQNHPAAQQKAQELAGTVAGFQVLLGLVAIVAAVADMLFISGVLGPM